MTTRLIRRLIFKSIPLLCKSSTRPAIADAFFCRWVAKRDIPFSCKISNLHWRVVKAKFPLQFDSAFCWFHIIFYISNLLGGCKYKMFFTILWKVHIVILKVWIESAGVKAFSLQHNICRIETFYTNVVQFEFIGWVCTKISNQYCIALWKCIFNGWAYDKKKYDMKIMIRL